MNFEIKYKKLEINKDKEEAIMAIEETRLIEISEKFERQHITNEEEYGVIERRAGGSFRHKAFYLPNITYDWVLGKDEEDVLCLVPLKKQ